MSLVCPNGHQSEAVDFCDTCGAKIDAAAQPAVAGTGAAAAPGAGGSGGASTAGGSELACPHCGVENLPGSLFCEACGYDFTTGAMPRGVEPPESTTAAPDPATAVPPGGAGNSLDLFGESPSAATPSTDPVSVAAEPVAPGPTAPDPVPTTPSPATPDPVPPAGAPAGGASAAAAAVPAAGAAASGSGIPPAIPLDWVAEVWIDPDWYAGQETDDPMPSPGLPTVVPLTVRSALIGRVSASKNIHPEIDCSTDTGVSRRQAQLTTDGSRWFVEDLDSANGTFVGGAGDALPEDPIAVGPRRELDEDDRIYVGAWTRIVVRRATDEEKAAAAGSTA